MPLVFLHVKKDCYPNANSPNPRMQFTAWLLEGLPTTLSTTLTVVSGRTYSPNEVAIKVMVTDPGSRRIADVWLDIQPIWQRRLVRRQQRIRGTLLDHILEMLQSMRQRNGFNTEYPEPSVDLDLSFRRGCGAATSRGTIIATW
jgi:hypothetical protein